MIMNSLLCASDEIAAQTYLDPKNEKFRILDFISGQSVVNDAFSVILFTTVTNHFTTETSLASSQILWSSFLFFKNVFFEGFVSIMIGLVYAFACTYILKRMRSLSKSPIGCTLIFCFGYLSYLTAEINSRSGIIAILTCSMVMANYAWFNLSPQGKQSSVIILKFLGYMVSGMIFSYIGLTFWSYRQYRWSTELISG